MLQAMSYRCLDTWDRMYHRYHRLQTVGPLLYVGSQRYAGDERVFPDGTTLRRGDSLGTLHFNNAYIASFARERDRHRTAWRFTRELRESLEALAAFSASAAGSSLAVYHGITWMLAHGLKVGFVSETFPPGWRSQFLRFHFRLLKACFAPASFRRSGGDPEPRIFWITRDQLQQSFGRRME